jgi:hypothetical protein
LTLSQPRLNRVLLTMFAAMALTLAALGLYGVLAQSTSHAAQVDGILMA